MAGLRKIASSWLPIFLLVVAAVCAVTHVTLSKDVGSLESTHGRGLGGKLPDFTPDELAYKVSSSIVLMATVIVIFSVCMEQFVMEPLKEEQDLNLQPIIQTMFSELTLLGFVGLFMFIVEKLDLLSAPSYHIFRDKEMLAEYFEDVHMVVFLVMVLFLLNSFALLKVGRATQKKWHHANVSCQGENRKLLIEEYSELLRTGQKVPKELDFKLAFMALRDRFTMAKERADAKREDEIAAKVAAGNAAGGSSKEESPKKRVLKKDQIPHDFDLAHYFGKRMGDKSGEIIEVPVKTWFCLEIFLIVIWVVQLPLNSFQFSCMFIGVGYLMMLMGYCIDVHLKTVMGQLIPPFHYEKCRRLAECRKGATEIDTLKDDGKFTSVCVGKDSKAHLPPFELHEITAIVKAHGSIKRFLFGEVPSKQQNLFFGGAKGEEILTTLIRLEALGSAIYVAIFFVVMLNPLLVHFVGQPIKLAMVLLIAAIPVVVNFFMLSVMVSDFVVVTSVEHMKDVKDIQITKRVMITRKAMTALKLLNTMRLSLPSMSKDGASTKKTAEEVWPDKEEREEKRVEMREMFDLFDTSGDGEIDETELGAILSMMHIGEDPADRKRIYDELDEDGEGGIDFEEFFHWIASHTASKGEELGEEELEEMANQLFEMIDQVDPETGERDGEITPREFFDTVSQLGKGKADMQLTLEDIEAMFKGVDENDDGKLDEEEFMAMIKEFMFED